MTAEVLPGRLLTPQDNLTLAARLLRTMICMTANCEAISCIRQKSGLCDIETGQSKGSQGLLWLQVYLDSSSGQAIVVEIVVRLPVPSAWPRRSFQCRCIWPASWPLNSAQQLRLPALGTTGTCDATSRHRAGSLLLPRPGGCVRRHSPACPHPEAWCGLAPFALMPYLCPSEAAMLAAAACPVQRINASMCRWVLPRRGGLASLGLLPYTLLYLMPQHVLAARDS